MSRSTEQMGVSVQQKAIRTSVYLPLRLLRIVTFCAVCFAIAASFSGPVRISPASASETPANDRRALPEFRLQDFGGKEFTASDFSAARVLVVGVLGVECPLARLAASKLKDLQSNHDLANVCVVGIDPNVQDSPSEMAAFHRELALNYPLLKDLGNHLADALGAGRTPEVFVFNKDRMLVYRGMIDDQHSIGRSRPKPTAEPMLRAVADLLAGKTPGYQQTETVGCLIGRVSEPDPNSAVTYSQHVSRVLADRCVSCHRPGEIGPFSLVNYEEARGWAEMIGEVTRERRMPPWHADPAYGHFSNANRLTDSELEMIGAWVRAGAPEGDPTLLPEPKTYVTGWQLPKAPDVVVPMRDKPFPVPRDGEVRYQYFVADPGFMEDKWVSAVEIMPGNRAVVHHVIVFASHDGKKFDGGRQFLSAYVPGLRVRPFAEGMAKKIPAKSKLIFQVHYTPNGAPAEDLSSIGLIFADPSKITHELRTESVGQEKFAIPPFTGGHKVNSNEVEVPSEMLLVSMSPHMHLRGQSFRYEVIWPGGDKETLLDVPHYDFNWQTAYMLEEPIELPAGAKIRAFATFDNSTNNLANPNPSATVRWGDQSWEEMMLGYFDVAIPRDASPGVPLNLSRVHRFSPDPAVAGPRLLRWLDKNRDGKVTKDEVPAKHFALFKELDSNGDNALEADELGKGVAKIRLALTNPK